MADTLQMLGRGAQILIALGAAYVIALWFVLIVWTFRDIEARSRSVLTQIFSTLMVVLFFVPGVLLYLILRPKETLDEAFQRSLEEEYLLQDLEELPLCPSCHRYVEDDFVLCPNCRSQLREACLGCARLVDLRWALCPYCGTSQVDRSELAEQVEAPAARWSAPSLRRRRTPAEPRLAEGRPAAIRELTPRAPRSVSSDDEQPVARPDAEDAKALSVVGGMRSIVRPFDRFRPRPVKDTKVERTQGDMNGRSNGHSSNLAETIEARAGSNGGGAAHQAHRLFDALNGRAGDHAADAAPSRSTSPTRPDANSNGADQETEGDVATRVTVSNTRDGRDPLTGDDPSATVPTPRVKGEG